MKKYYSISTLFVLIYVNVSFAQQKNDAYKFPIRPGMETWKEFKSGQKMIDACQIPAITLQSMSTAGLVRTCLDYPLLSTIFAYNDLQSGFNALKQNFNGFQELLIRKDAGKEIIKVYQQLHPDSLKQSWSLAQQGHFVHQFTYIEVLLAQYSIQQNLSSAEKKGLVSESLDKFKGKERHAQTFGGSGISTCAWVMGRVLEKEMNSKSTVYQQSTAGTAVPMKVFLEHGLVYDTQVINQVVADAQSYLR
jgi:hypothetical protein